MPPVSSAPSADPNVVPGLHVERMRPPVRHREPPLVAFENAELVASKGRVYGPLRFESTARFVALIGNRGAGRTALLLSIAGRMRTSGGRILLRGLDTKKQARAVRKMAGIAGFSGIDDLEPMVRVRDMLRERAVWASPWYRWVGAFDGARADGVLAPVFGREPRPDPDQMVNTLTEEQEYLLKVTLALMERPSVIIADDVAQVHDSRARQRIITRLAHLVEQGIDVVMVSADIRDFHLRLPVQVQVTPLDRIVAPPDGLHVSGEDERAVAR